MWLVLGCGCLAVASARAHEGEPQRAPAPATPVVAIPAAGTAERDEPRLALANARLELVAVAEGERWAIYLDDYASNTPLEGLDVEVLAGSLRLPATAAGEGRYEIPAAMFDPAVPRPVSFVVRGRASGFPGILFDERLDGVLPASMTQPSSAVAAYKSGRAWMPSLAISLFVLPLLALKLRRRRT